MSIQEVVKHCEVLGVMMKLIYCIFAPIIILNMIQMSYLIKFFIYFCSKFDFFDTLEHGILFDRLQE